MKKILFALAILPLLAFVACSSDDDNTPKVDFDHNIELLYGEWRATSVVLGELVIDLTSPEMEAMIAPTFVTFTEGGVYSTKGILGEGTGVFTTKDKTIATVVGENKVSFEMTSLEAQTAKIELNPSDLELPFPIEDNEGEGDEIETVTVVLTKQAAE